MTMLTTAELAEKYGITTQAIRYWRKNGCPYKTEKIRRIGHKISFVHDEIEVEKWLKGESQ